MTEITFTIPEWARDKNISIFAGSELLAVKSCRIIHQDGKHVSVYEQLEIKPEGGRCSGCSVCCSDGSGIAEDVLNEMKVRLKDYVFSGTKPCPMLTETGCVLRGWIPFSCVKSICTGYEGCTEYLE